IMKDIPFNEGEHLMFLDPDNHAFHVDNPAFYQEVQRSSWLGRVGESKAGQLTWSDGDRRYLVVYNVGEQQNWKLIKPIPYEEIYAAATTTRNLGYGIGLLFLLVSIILVTFLSNAITKPLKKLSRQMSLFSSGSFDVEAQVKGRDEIAFLTRHFNEMVKNTNDLINERYKMKLVEKNAILKALEAEINPHFLYNALQAISTKALKSSEFEIADMVDALALTLRYCISGKDIVYAREELKHIERYLVLQKARFGSRLHVEIRWDQSLMELQIPKLSIQTLVENSIKHAVERVSGTVTIIIQAELTPTQTIISVMDNGPGIPPGRLKQVLGSFQSSWEERENDNIGLTNLNTRLKLLYGETAGLEIRTNKTGTEMRMVIEGGGGSRVQGVDY
ncbi:sensor histidine kinase, partial [Paenibacillus sepulcri]|nr:sensor histidine kinase [Paenibacillus sepulcri]